MYRSWRTLPAPWLPWLGPNARLALDPLPRPSWGPRLALRLLLLLHPLHLKLFQVSHDVNPGRPVRIIHQHLFVYLDVLHVIVHLVNGDRKPVP